MSVALTVFAAVWLGAWDAEYEIYGFQMPVLYNLFYNGFGVLISLMIVAFIWRKHKSKAMIAGLACYNSIMSFWSLVFAMWLLAFKSWQFWAIYANQKIGLGLNLFVPMEWFWFVNEVWMSMAVVLWLFAFLVR